MTLLSHGSAQSPATALVNFAPVKSRSREIVLMDVTLLLEVLAFLIIWPLVRWRHELDWTFVLFMVGMVIGVVALLWIVTRDFRRRHADTRLLWPIFAVCTVGVLAVLYPWDQTPAVNATIYRILHLTSGLSPMPPLLFLLAAGLWRAWHSLNALSFLDQRTPRLPTNTNLGVPDVAPANTSTF